ncbi:hypothetical protein ScPMuIL_005859 [Solemya velum]
MGCASSNAEIGNEKEAHKFDEPFNSNKTKPSKKTEQKEPESEQKKSKKNGESISKKLHEKSESGNESALSKSTVPNNFDASRVAHRTRWKTALTKLKERKKRGTCGSKKLKNTVKQAISVQEPLDHPEYQILCGNVNTECPSTAKVVRIFTSSTFTDTKNERNTLMETTYPRLKQFCQKHGYEFQVVDMRWGIREEATDDHMVLELCMKELELCQKLSTGPNFVSLLSHKYGYRLFPRQILLSEFDLLLQNVPEGEDKKLLQKWFLKDDNVVPPSYVLQSISTHIPDFLSSDSKKRNNAKNIWSTESEKMREALEEASQVLNPKDAQKYIMSVTEAELREGLLNEKKVEKCCLWVKREIKDIENQTNSEVLSKYIDCTGTEEKWTKSRALMKNLRDEYMIKKLPKNNILEYDVEWSENGIDPKMNEKHRAYLTKFSNDLEAKLTSMIDDAFREKSKAKINHPVFTEVLQHVQFCQSKCQDFYGRSATLKKIQDYIKSDNVRVLVVHGKSGCGKTSILAMAAKQCWKWLGGKATIVFRFLGTTPRSSEIRPLLGSLTHQINKVHRQISLLPDSMKELTAVFHKSLKLATKEQPLVLILDSLDQLDVSDGAHQLAWIPRKLPPNVKLVVSTLPESMYEILPKLKTIVADKTNFLSVPVLPDSDVTVIVDKWLLSRQRALTSSQRTKLLASFQRCPLPLFLKLSFDEASLWKSYSPESITVLQTTVRESILHMFTKIETLHGNTLVSRALGYLTISQSGLTEAELEDILSCDDDVLNDVYMYWTPPVRRLPPLLVVRLKTDLSQYLVDRGGDGARVMYWYHRQFIEAARSRYCKDPKINRMLHESLANFFSGTWSGQKKPYTAKGQNGTADRHVVPQPLHLGQSYNLRKIKNLPYHRIKANELSLLKTECLGSFEFLIAKLHATSLRLLLDDYIGARKAFPEDKELELISDALELSQDALMSDANQLAPQLLGRLQGFKDVEGFLKQCELLSVPYLYPDRSLLIQPGGQLIHCLAGHGQGEIQSLDITENGKTCVTCGKDDTVKFWDVAKGRLIRSIDGIGSGMLDAVICANEKVILLFSAEKIQAINFDSGTLKYTINHGDYSSKCVAGPNKSLLATCMENRIKLYDTNTGNFLQEIAHSNTLVNFDGLACGSTNYIALGDSSDRYFCTLDLKKKQFSKRVCWPAREDDDDDDDDDGCMEALTISNDEKFLYISTVNDNLDIFRIKTLKLLKSLKGESNGYASTNFYTTKDSKFIHFAKGCEVAFWDLEKEFLSLMMKHPVMVRDVKTADWRYFITISDDTVVRIWDTTIKRSAGRPIESQLFYGNCSIMGHLNPLKDSNYLVTRVTLTDDEDDVSLVVYDVEKKSIVRKLSLKSDQSVMSVWPLDQKSVIISTQSRKLKILDLDTLAVQKTFQGMSCKSNDMLVLLNGGKEVAVPTKGQKHLKIYDVASGICIKKIDCSESCGSTKIDRLEANSSGTIVVVLKTEELDEDEYGTSESAFIYKSETSAMSVLKKDDLSSSSEYIVNGIFEMTKDGSLLFFTVAATPEGGDPERECVDFVVSWDTRKDKKHLEFIDLAYHANYQTGDNSKGLGVGVDTIEILDDEKLISAHDDFLIRVWDIQSGALLHHLEGHHTTPDMYVSENSPYFVSQGSCFEDNAFRLWDKKMFNCIAAYNHECQIEQLCWSTDGLSVIGGQSYPIDFIMWSLYEKGINKSSPTDKMAIVLEGTVEKTGIEIESDDVYEESDDLDTDSDSSDDSEDE